MKCILYSYLLTSMCHKRIFLIDLSNNVLMENVYCSFAFHESYILVSTYKNGKMLLCLISRIKKFQEYGALLRTKIPM